MAFPRGAFETPRSLFASSGDPGAVDLGEQVSALDHAASRVRLLDEVLASVPARPADARLRHAVGAIADAAGAIRVAGLAKTLGVGERQLERLFDERVGIGPKALARVARVQGLLRRLGPHVQWSSLAADSRAGAIRPTSRETSTTSPG